MEDSSDGANPTSTGILFDDPDPEQRVAEVGPTILSDTGKLLPRLHNLTTAIFEPSPSGRYVPRLLPRSYVWK
jgi:hypothetical protein